MFNIIIPWYAEIKWTNTFVAKPALCFTITKAIIFEHNSCNTFEVGLSPAFRLMLKSWLRSSSTEHCWATKGSKPKMIQLMIAMIMFAIKIAIWNDYYCWQPRGANLTWARWWLQWLQDDYRDHVCNHDCDLNDGHDEDHDSCTVEYDADCTFDCDDEM